MIYRPPRFGIGVDPSGGVAPEIVFFIHEHLQFVGLCVIVQT
jgi:hypothetical protein